MEGGEEAGLPPPGGNPVPRPPKQPPSRPSGIRIVFEPEPDLRPRGQEIFGPTEWGWFNKLAKPPYDMKICAMGYLEESSRYAIDVSAAGDTVEAVVGIVRSTIGSQGRGFSTDLFGSR